MTRLRDSMRAMRGACVLRRLDACDWRVYHGRRQRLTVGEGDQDFLSHSAFAQHSRLLPGLLTRAWASSVLGEMRMKWSRVFRSAAHETTHHSLARCCLPVASSAAVPSVSSGKRLSFHLSHFFIRDTQHTHSALESQGASRTGRAVEYSYGAPTNIETRTLTRNKGSYGDRLAMGL